MSKDVTFRIFYARTVMYYKELSNGTTQQGWDLPFNIKNETETVFTDSNYRYSNCGDYYVPSSRNNLINIINAAYNAYPEKYTSTEYCVKATSPNDRVAYFVYNITLPVGEYTISANKMSLSKKVDTKLGDLSISAKKNGKSCLIAAGYYNGTWWEPYIEWVD